MWWRKKIPANFLVLDLELSGLDANKHHILSFAMVTIVDGEIDVSSVIDNKILIDQSIELENSPAVHGLTHNDLSQGILLESFLKQFIQLMASKPLIVVGHYITLDLQFIKQACKNHQLDMPKIKYIDTLITEKNKLEHQGQLIKEDALTLNQCTARHKLPKLKDHQAINDTFSAAYLWLHQLINQQGSTQVYCHQLSLKHFS